MKLRFIDFLHSGWLRYIAASFFVGLPTLAFAGAWLQPAQHGQLINQASHYSANAFWNADGELTPQNRFSKYELQTYAEYGLNDSLTIGASTYAQRVSQSGDTNLGLADTELFARTMLWQKNGEILSIQPLIKLPSTFAHNRTPRGGSKSSDLELSLLYGRNLSILDARDFIDIRVGYRARLNRLSDQCRADALLGIYFSDQWLFMPAIRSVYAAQVPSSAFSENGEQDYALTKAEVTLQYILSPQQRMGISMFHHLQGVQTGSGWGASFSFTQGF